MPNFNADGSLIEVQQTPDELFSTIDSSALNWIFKNLSINPDKPDYEVTLQEVADPKFMTSLYVVTETSSNDVIAMSSNTIRLISELKDALGSRYHDRMIKVYQGWISNEAERVKRKAEQVVKENVDTELEGDDNNDV